MNEKPAFCATCIEEASDLKRCIRNGRTVWLCKFCQTPLGVLAQHDLDTTEFGAIGSGNRKRGRTS